MSADKSNGTPDGKKKNLGVKRSDCRISGIPEIRISGNPDIRFPENRPKNTLKSYTGSLHGKPLKRGCLVRLPGSARRPAVSLVISEAHHPRNAICTWDSKWNGEAIAIPIADVTTIGFFAYDIKRSGNSSKRAFTMLANMGFQIWNHV